MPDSKSFSQLTTAESLDISDLYALSKTDTNAGSGYVSRSASFSTIANAIVNSVEFAELIIRLWVLSMKFSRRQI